MDLLNQLQQEMRQCRQCLTAGYHIVPGAVFRGTSQAKILLIGQAPGVTEVEAKRPFNAGSGRRLFQWLAEAGWDESTFREQQYMTAVTKCYPGKHPNGKGDRVPSKAEQALCRPFLEREIALVNPRVMILVGGLAIKLMYPNSTRLQDLIGTTAYFPPEALTNPVNFKLKDAHHLPAFDPHKPANGRWIVPLPHPSGASLWYNDPENQRLVQQAMLILRDLKAFYENLK